MSNDRGDAGVRSVTRTIDLLELFDVEHPARTVRELAEATGLPKTTVVRLVATLVQRDVLAQRPDGSLTLGAGFLRWARVAGSVWELPEQAQEVMRALAEDTGETVNLYVRQGMSRFVVAQHESTATVRNVVPVGTRMPLWAGAAGKVLLAGSPDLVKEAAAASPYGPEAADSLRAAAEAAAELGYAVTHGEREFGASGVAAPVTNGSGRIVAALALGGPTSRFTAERVTGFITAVTEAARRLSNIGLPGLEALG
ncbi:IclR family transcriptional regulator [Streptomyces sp. 8N616]|uniref:IclR family transcriptional regulator n=1 Tax=Streptomyces sp. 8N616 TaxID=3457414 RepID=UPI003FD33F4C